jgi:hypothetical protein
MSSTARLIAAGAAAVLVVGIGFFALGSGPGPGPGASPSPSALATESPSPSLSAELPTALRHPYLGPLRAVDGIPPGDVSQLEFGARSFVYHNGPSSFMRSAAGVDGDEIVLRSETASTGCETGDEGRYRFSTSPEGSILTIEPGTDGCAARLAAVPGSWQRSQCTDTNNWCLGVVESGTYSSQYVDVATQRGTTPRTDFGALVYTVPSGWANSDDWPSMYAIMRGSSYAAGGFNEGVVAPDTITLLARPSAASLDACAEKAEPGVGTDRAALTAWILAHPGLVVTEQPAVTIDGLQASVLDLAVADDWTETCDTANPFVAAPVLVGDYHFALAKGDRMRVILVDLPAGATAAITIEVEDPATFDTLLAEAMPIVESFDFK